METTRPPPSPLSGGYLLIVISEPQIETHKAAILKKISKDFLSWDVGESGIDIECELAIVTALAPEGDLSKSGERLIQNASEHLVTEILIQPQINTVRQCVRNLLSSFTKYKFIIHAGYTFCGNGSWILQDGTFSMADFVDAFQEMEVQRVIRAYEKTVKIDVCCISEGGWNQARINQESFSKFCRVEINPNDKLPSGCVAINEFSQYLDSFIVAQDICDVLEPSDVVGNIRFTRPTLYVFPGGDGDAALFGINGFNMLVDGGFSRRACFWNFVRHLDRLDAVLFSRINNTNIGGIAGIVQRKVLSPVYPQIGHFFANLQIRKSLPSPDGDKDKDPLLVNLIDEGDRMVMNLKHLQLKPHLCYRDPNNEPINLYHKVGHGKLDMYVVSPTKDSHEVKEFLSRWHSHDIKLFGTTAENAKSGERELHIPLQNLVSICALIVWQPANPEDHVTRILFPGSVPQSKIFEGLESTKILEFFKSPICLMKTIHPATQISNINKRIMKMSAEEKISYPKSEKIIPDSDAIQLKSEFAENENVAATNRTITTDEKIKKAQARRKRTERSPTIKLKEAKTTHTIKETQLKQSTEKLAEGKISEKKEIITNKGEIKKTEKKVIPIEKKSKPVPTDQKTDSDKSSPITSKKSFTSVKDSSSVFSSTTKDSPATSVSTATAKDSSSITTALRDSFSIKSTTSSTRSTSVVKTSPKILPAKRVKEENNLRMVAAKQERGVTPPKLVPSPQTTLTTTTTESSKPVRKEKIKLKPASVKIAKQTTTVATASITSTTTAIKSVRRPIATKKLEDDKKSLTLEGQTIPLQTTTKKQSIDTVAETKETRVSEEMLADVTNDEFQTTNIQTTDSTSAALYVTNIIINEAGNDEDEILIIETTETEPVATVIIDNEESKYSLDEKESEKGTLKNLITPEKENDMPVMEIQMDNEENLEKVTDKALLSLDQENLNNQLNGNITTATKIIINREKSDEDIEKSSESHKKEEIVADSADDIIIANISEEKSSTTAPTMPEDERIDDKKQEIEEKSDKEETKGKEKKILADIVHHEVFDKTRQHEANLPSTRIAQQKKIIISTSVVKTPDEVADLPVDEEVDIKKIYDTSSRKLKIDEVEEPIIKAVVEAQLPEIVNITPTSSPDEKIATFPTHTIDNQFLIADNLLPEGLFPIIVGQDLDITNETNTDDNLIEIPSQIKDKTNNLLDNQHLTTIKKEPFIICKKLVVEDGQNNTMQQGDYFLDISNEAPVSQEEPKFAYKDKSVKLKSSALFTKLEMEGQEEAETSKSLEETSEKTESKDLVLNKKPKLPKEIITPPNLNEELKFSQLFHSKQSSSVVHITSSPSECINIDEKDQTQQIIDGDASILAQQEKYKEHRFLSDSKELSSNGDLKDQRKPQQEDLHKSKEVIDEENNSTKDLGTDDKRKDPTNFDSQQICTETDITLSHLKSKSGIESFDKLKIHHSNDTGKVFTLGEKGDIKSTFKEEILESRKDSIQVEKPKGTSYLSPSESSPKVDERSEDQIGNEKKLSLNLIEDATISEHMLPETDKESAIPLKKSQNHSISSPDEKTCTQNQNIFPEIDVKRSVQFKVLDKPVITTSQYSLFTQEPNPEQSPDEKLSNNIDNKSLDQSSLKLKSSLQLSYGEEISKSDEESLIQFEKQEKHIKNKDSSSDDNSTVDLSISEKISIEIDDKISVQLKEPKQISKTKDLSFDGSQLSANGMITTKTDKTSSVQLEKQVEHPLPTSTDSSSNKKLSMESKPKSSVQLQESEKCFSNDSSTDKKTSSDLSYCEDILNETRGELNIERSYSAKTSSGTDRKSSIKLEESKKQLQSKVSSPDGKTTIDFTLNEALSYDTDNKRPVLLEKSELAPPKDSSPDDRKISKDSGQSEKMSPGTDEKCSVQLEESLQLSLSRDYSMGENSNREPRLSEIITSKTNKEHVEVKESQKISLSKHSSLDDENPNVDSSPIEKIVHHSDEKSSAQFKELQELTVSKDFYPSEKSNIESSPNENMISETDKKTIHLEELQKLSPSKDSSPTKRMSLETDKESVQLEESQKSALSKHSQIDDEKPNLELSPTDKIVHGIDKKSSAQCEESHKVAVSKDSYPSEKSKTELSPNEKVTSKTDTETIHLEELQELSSSKHSSPNENIALETDKENAQLQKPQKPYLSKHSGFDDKKPSTYSSCSEKIVHDNDEKSSAKFEESEKITVSKDSYPCGKSNIEISPSEKMTSETADKEIIHLEEIQKLSPSNDLSPTESMSLETDKESAQLEKSQKLSLSKHSSIDDEKPSVDSSPRKKIVHDIDKNNSAQLKESQQITVSEDSFPREKPNIELNSSEKVTSKTDAEIIHLEEFHKLSLSKDSSPGDKKLNIDSSPCEKISIETDQESVLLEKLQIHSPGNSLHGDVEYILTKEMLVEKGKKNSSSHFEEPQKEMLSKDSQLKNNLSMLKEIKCDTEQPLEIILSIESDKQQETHLQHSEKLLADKIKDHKLPLEIYKQSDSLESVTDYQKENHKLSVSESRHHEHSLTFSQSSKVEESVIHSNIESKTPSSNESKKPKNENISDDSSIEPKCDLMKGPGLSDEQLNDKQKVQDQPHILSLQDELHHSIENLKIECDKKDSHQSLIKSDGKASTPVKQISYQDCKTSTWHTEEQQNQHGKDEILSLSDRHKSGTDLMPIYNESSKIVREDSADTDREMHPRVDKRYSVDVTQGSIPEVNKRDLAPVCKESSLTTKRIDSVIISPDMSLECYKKYSILTSKKSSYQTKKSDSDDMNVVSTPQIDRRDSATGRKYSSKETSPEIDEKDSIVTNNESSPQCDKTDSIYVAQEESTKINKGDSVPLSKESSLDTSKKHSLVSSEKISPTIHKIDLAVTKEELSPPHVKNCSICMTQETSSGMDRRDPVTISKDSSLINLREDSTFTSKGICSKIDERDSEVLKEGVNILDDVETPPICATQNIFSGTARKDLVLGNEDTIPTIGKKDSEHVDKEISLENDRTDLIVTNKELSPPSARLDPISIIQDLIISSERRDSILVNKDLSPTSTRKKSITDSQSTTHKNDRKDSAFTEEALSPPSAQTDSIIVTKEYNPAIGRKDSIILSEQRSQKTDIKDSIVSSREPNSPCDKKTSICTTQEINLDISRKDSVTIIKEASHTVGRKDTIFITQESNSGKNESNSIQVCKESSPPNIKKVSIPDGKNSTVSSPDDEKESINITQVSSSVINKEDSIPVDKKSSPTLTKKDITVTNEKANIENNEGNSMLSTKISSLTIEKIHSELFKKEKSFTFVNEDLTAINQESSPKSDKRDSPRSEICRRDSMAANEETSLTTYKQDSIVCKESNLTSNEGTIQGYISKSEKKGSEPTKEESSLVIDKADSAFASKESTPKIDAHLIDSKSSLKCDKKDLEPDKVSSWNSERKYSRSFDKEISSTIDGRDSEYASEESSPKIDSDKISKKSSPVGDRRPSSTNKEELSFKSEGRGIKHSSEKGRRDSVVAGKESSPIHDNHSRLAIEPSSKKDDKNNAIFSSKELSSKVNVQLSSKESSPIRNEEDLALSQNETSFTLNEKDIAKKSEIETGSFQMDGSQTLSEICVTELTQAKTETKKEIQLSTELEINTEQKSLTDAPEQSTDSDKETPPSTSISQNKLEIRESLQADVEQPSKTISRINSEKLKEEQFPDERDSISPSSEHALSSARESSIQLHETMTSKYVSLTDQRTNVIELHHTPLRKSVAEVKSEKILQSSIAVKTLETEEHLQKEKTIDNGVLQKMPSEKSKVNIVNDIKNYGMQSTQSVGSYIKNHETSENNIMSEDVIKKIHSEEDISTNGKISTVESIQNEEFEKKDYLNTKTEKHDFPHDIFTSYKLPSTESDFSDLKNGSILARKDPSSITETNIIPATILYPSDQKCSSKTGSKSEIESKTSSDVDTRRTSTDTVTTYEQKSSSHFDESDTISEDVHLSSCGTCQSSRFSISSSSMCEQGESSDSDQGSTQDLSNLKTTSITTITDTSSSSSSFIKQSEHPPRPPKSGTILSLLGTQSSSFHSSNVIHSTIEDQTDKESKSTEDVEYSTQEIQSMTTILTDKDGISAQCIDQALTEDQANVPTSIISTADSIKNANVQCMQKTTSIITTESQQVMSGIIEEKISASSKDTMSLSNGNQRGSQTDITTTTKKVLSPAVQLDASHMRVQFTSITDDGQNGTCAISSTKETNKDINEDQWRSNSKDIITSLGASSMIKSKIDVKDKIEKTSSLPVLDNTHQHSIQIIDQVKVTIQPVSTEQDISKSHPCLEKIEYGDGTSSTLINLSDPALSKELRGSELNSKSISLPVIKRPDEAENLINLPYLYKSANLEDLTSAQGTEVVQLQSQSDIMHSTTSYRGSSTEIEMFHDAGSSISEIAPISETEEPLPADEKVLTKIHASKYETIQKFSDSDTKTSDDQNAIDNQKLKHNSRTSSNKEETAIKSTITSLTGVQMIDDPSSNSEKKTKIFSSVPASMMQSFYGTLPDDDIEDDDDDNEAFEESHSTFVTETTTEASCPTTASDSTSVFNVISSITSTPLPPDTDPIAGWGKPFGLPLGKSANNLNTLLIWNPLESWGKPFGLPSPGPPQSLSPPSVPSQHRNSDSDIELNLTPLINKTTPKKVVSKKSTNERAAKDVSMAKDMSVTKKQIRTSKQVTPVYVDLAYVPHHGNPHYTNVEFFKRIRARYYVFSGTDAAKDVFDALLEAKKSWENQDLEVTIIPTYDTDVLGYWITENEEALSNLRIDLAPSANRCTINLQDHDTSCSAYRLEF